MINIIKQEITMEESLKQSVEREKSLQKICILLRQITLVIRKEIVL